LTDIARKCLDVCGNLKIQIEIVRSEALGYSAMLLLQPHVEIG